MIPAADGIFPRHGWLKHSANDAHGGAHLVRGHTIRVTEEAFDDFADGGTDEAGDLRVLGVYGETAE